MLEKTFKVELLSGAVVTADSATAGGHRGLDFLPGSVFLGAAAAQAQREGVFQAGFFLSGEVRFLDALPDVGSNPSFPIPLSFHRGKGADWEGKTPCNLVYEEPPEGVQVQQWRSGYMSEDGQVLQVVLDHRMKTAVDREQRRSAVGQLFGYQSIPSGTVLRMRVQVEKAENLARVSGWFDGHTIRVGRSRSAEYGTARLTALSSGPESQPGNGGERLVLYLVSDLALLRDGMPSLLPEAKDFGIPENAGFDSGNSFLRARRYSPWNSFFNCRMGERLVLCRGGVIAFQLPKGTACDRAALQKRLASGVGLNREEGLGQLLVDPPWLLKPPVLTRYQAKEPPAQGMPKTLLTDYLKRKHQRRQTSFEAFKTGLEWAQEWGRLAKRVRDEHGKAPGKSQWAGVREIAVRCQTQPNSLSQQIEQFCGEALRRKLWQAKAGRGGSLLDAVKGKVGLSPTGKECLALYHAAVEMGRLIGRGS